jgi:glycosidase
MKRLLLSLACASLGAATIVACGSDTPHNQDFGTPPDASLFNPGQGAGGSGYGSGNGAQPGSVGPTSFDAGPPVCSDDLKRCAEQFTYPYGGETSVELRGDYRDGAWSSGDAMTHTGAQWTVTVPVPWNKQVLFKFFVNGTTWKVDPAQPTVTDATNNTNNVKTPITCPGTYTCDEPPPPPPGVFDWRDAVIYFVFIDRFFDGNPANNCNVSGSQQTSYVTTNYDGGDWAGVTAKINAGYFNDLGVNTLWITVPIKGADDVAEPGVNGDTHMYSGYHGYWPKDPTATEDCFGTAADLKAMVDAAHAKGLKILFDYAMVHVHTESSIYQQHKNDSPSWFTPDCICGASGCGNFDTSCWFTDYLAHYDYTNPAARTFSVNAAISLIQNNGNDAFRLDAIKQVDPSWLKALRPAIASQILAKQTPQQRFYMVGETYDFQNRGLIKSMIDPTNGLDGQFDFPLRIRLVEGVLIRSTQNMLTIDDLNWSRTAPPGMQGLAQFMDANDGYYGSEAVMSTFIGNHDLPRSIHYAEDTPFWSNSADDGKANAWANEPQLSTNPRAYERLANAFAVLMTNKGAPLLYYGDEIGLPGAGDPDNRRMMQWSGLTSDQQGLHDRIKALLGLRAKHPAMRRGHRQTLSADADLWVYELTSPADADTVYVGINRSDADRTSTNVPSGLPELLAGGTSSGTVTIPARQTRIWSSSTPAIADAGTD